MTTSISLSRKILTATVIVTSLGNFIDMFDLLLFNMERVKSLTSFGLSGAALTDAGIAVSNCQLAGALIGAYLWGICGDRFGRKTSLLVSIFVYSVGSIASGLTHSVPHYMIARLVTGFGIAGELGAGLALIGEGLAAEWRGRGTAIFIVVGFSGVVTAALVSQWLDWRTAYIIGGIGGLLMLLTRSFVPESALYKIAASHPGRRGGLAFVLRKPEALRRYLGGIALLTTGTFLPQIIWTLSPEIAKAKGVTEPVVASNVLMIGFGCGIVFDFIAAQLCDVVKSRSKGALISLLAGVPCFVVYLLWPTRTAVEFYIANVVVAVGFGTWTIACAWMAESFGTNVRSTVATTAPNFARGAAIVMNLAYKRLKVFGALHACAAIGVAVFLAAFIGWSQLPETYGRDLNYDESL